MECAHISMADACVKPFDASRGIFISATLSFFSRKSEKGEILRGAIWPTENKMRDEFNELFSNVIEACLLLFLNILPSFAAENWLQYLFVVRMDVTRRHFFSLDSPSLVVFKSK